MPQPYALATSLVLALALPAPASASPLPAYPFVHVTNVDTRDFLAVDGLKLVQPVDVVFRLD